MATKKHKAAAVRYEIRVEGGLAPQWAEWFDGLTVTQGEGETILSVALADQAALFGLLYKIRDLGMTLISVNRAPRGQIQTEPSFKE